MRDCYKIRVEKCHWIKNQVKQCKETREEREKVCSNWQDKGYSQCTQWRDDGHKACGAWQKNCCTWWPCSWLCTVFFWICTAVVWVSNLVCIATIWVTNLVCVAWVWVVYAVCIVWTTVVSYICIAFAWYAYWICIFPEFVQNVGLWVQWQFIQMSQCIRPRDKPRNPIEKPGWKLTFEDDFDAGAIDFNKWQDLSYTGVRYNDSQLDQGIIPPVYFSPANFLFGPSTVKLISDKQPTVINNDPHYNGSFTIPYTGAWLQWKGLGLINQPFDPGPFDQLHGFFEIRCKIPGTPAQWPAFWFASRASWPPEIDVFEFFTTSNTDRFRATHHWGKDPKHPMQGTNHRVCKPSEYFHIYACEWTSTQIRWYCDNHLVRVSSNGLSDFIYHMSMIIGTGIQEDAHPEDSTYPNYFEVDYVRAYTQ